MPPPLLATPSRVPVVGASSWGPDCRMTWAEPVPADMARCPTLLSLSSCPGRCKSAHERPGHHGHLLALLPSSHHPGPHRWTAPPSHQVGDRAWFVRLSPKTSCSGNGVPPRALSQPLAPLYFLLRGPWGCFCPALSFPALPWAKGPGVLSAAELHLPPKMLIHEPPMSGSKTTPTFQMELVCFPLVRM